VSASPNKRDNIDNIRDAANWKSITPPKLTTNYRAALNTPPPVPLLNVAVKTIREKHRGA
jgi:hypothetical protein